MKTKMRAAFEKVFGTTDSIEDFFSPGRVNLIGEHTDYNGGHVFPCALTMGTYGLVRKRDDKALRFYSLNFEAVGVIESSLDELVFVEEDNWANYPKGVIWAMKEKGYEITQGFDLLVYGDIPNQSGLSSSASLEVLTGTIIKELYGFPDISMIDIALFGQYAENKFNGMNCGIMDQFAVAMGKKDHAIFLDTATLEYEYAPIKLAGAKIIIACSNKKRGLTDSKYNERRAESEAALAQIQTVKAIESLGDLTEEEFLEVQHVVEDPICRLRAKHAVFENQRTIHAVAALKAGDLVKFGKLMNDSHVSLRDDYEVTGIELDTLVDAAWQEPSVIGSRMTGAGFGGCTVSIVKDEGVDSFIERVGNTYKEKIGYAADFYVVDIGEGARKL